ncbi:MAG: 50S ribosome-binding GTPase [Oscillospiraceae bacterium]|nr:50S ribosome-binding GTPase [Oscillospiraceae bacterium]
MSNRIALLGQPNSGKSTIYNNLTGHARFDSVLCALVQQGRQR